MNKIEPGSILMGKKEIPIERANLDRETQAEMLKVPYLGKGIDRYKNSLIIIILIFHIYIIILYLGVK